MQTANKTIFQALYYVQSRIDIMIQYKEFYLHLTQAEIRPHIVVLFILCIHAFCRLLFSIDANEVLHFGKENVARNLQEMVLYVAAIFCKFQIEVRSILYSYHFIKSCFPVVPASVLQ